MKKSHLQIVISLSLMVTLFISCSKDSGTQPANPSPNPGNGNNNGGGSTVPTSFTQKVLIETFTGAGQAQCTDGFVKLDGIVNAANSKAIPVNVHFSDGMEIPQYTALETTYSGGSAMMYPSAMVNRTPSLSTVMLNRTQWQTNYDLAKNKTAKCGLSISSTVTSSTASIAINCGFNQVLTGNYTVTVYLIENNVKGSGSNYDQRNSYNTTSGHPYFNAGDPITNFNHQYVLRKVISASNGDAIAGEHLVAGGLETKNYTVAIGSYKPADLYIVAFITKIGTSNTTYEIMNVQRAKVGTTQNWD